MRQLTEQSVWLILGGIYWGVSSWFNPPKSSTIKLYNEGTIKSIDWHPLFEVVAVLQTEGEYSEVRLLEVAEEANQRVLRHELQRKAKSLSWDSSTGTSLAVGCDKGLIIWENIFTFDNHKQSKTCCQFLRSYQSLPVDRVAWGMGGSSNRIASVSLKDDHVTIWDTISLTIVARLALPRSWTSWIVGSQVLEWSPTGEFLFAGTT